MNAKYCIDKSTGLIDIRIKDTALDGFKENLKYSFEYYIIDMLQSNSKFCLTGTLPLVLLGFENIHETGDFDITSIENVTKEEYDAFVNNFDLQKLSNPNTAKNIEFTDSVMNINYDEKLNRFSFYKKTPDAKESVKANIYIDLFNPILKLNSSEYISVLYKQRKINICYPKITMILRFLFAIDPRVPINNKHLLRIKDFVNSEEKLKKWKDLHVYYYKMDWKRKEFNKIISNQIDKNKLVKEIIYNFSGSDDDLIDKLFDSILDDKIKSYTDLSSSELIAIGDIFYE